MNADQAQGVLPLPWFVGLLLIVPAAFAVRALWRAVQCAAKRKVDRAIDEALALTRWDDTPAPIKWAAKRNGDAR